MSAPVLVMIPDATGGGADGGAFHRADPEAPQLRVTDLAVTRGDGAFETVGVFGDHAAQLEEHLARLERSAEMLEIPGVDTALIRDALGFAVDAHREQEPGTGPLTVRIMLSRGLEGQPTASAWIHVAAAPDCSRERAGMRVAALDRGLPSTAARTSPWLLAGAKTLSYAVNMAAQREAARRGADDVLFISSDGYALEGPTSTLLVRRGEEFMSTPPEAGVLPGTSLAACAAHLRAGGRELTERLLTEEEVAQADAAWLLSSVRLATPITHLLLRDGREVALGVDRALSGELCAAIAGGPLD